MITIPIWTLVTLVQLVIILLVASIILHYRYRNFKNSSQQSATAYDTPLPPQPASAKPDTALLKELGQLRQRLAIAEKRVLNLEKFRELFFKIKHHMDTLLLAQEQVTSRFMAGAAPGNDPELVQALQKLKKEKETLEQHLKQVTDELDLLLANPSHGGSLSSEGLKAALGVKNVQEEVGNLTQIIADLEVEAATSNRINTSVTSVNTRLQEMETVMEVLQDENQFLSDQIQALLTLQRNEDAKLELEMERMSSAFTDKELELLEQKKKYTELEAEYLKLVK